MLLEAKSWSPTKNVNWSEIARRYGLRKKNSGQAIKEFLQTHNIAAAFTDQTPNRTPRRRRKILPGGIPFPMQRPINFQKQVLADKVEAGEILLGEEFVETSYSRYALDKTNNIIKESSRSVYVRKINLADLKKTTKST